MLHYILQTLFFQLCFLLAYELLLKKETFFGYNRWYLLLMPVIAMLLPLLKLEFLAEAVPGNARIMLPAVVIGGETAPETLPVANFTTEEGMNIIWGVIYCVGLAAGFGLFLKKAYHLNQLFRFGKTSEEKDFQIIEIPNSNIACTFFSTVFLGDQLSEEEKQQILSHELVHVRQKHSLDLMFFELLKIVFWFNPLMYIYQSRIAGLHEFIADQEVVKTAGKKNYYEQLLNTAFNTQNISFINQFFNHSLIKKRIVMLQKSKSTAIAKFKFLIIIPLMTLMLTYVACSEENPAGSEEQGTVSVSEKIAELDVYLETKDSLTEEEKEQFLNLLKKREELLLKQRKANGSGIIEVVEEQRDNSEIPFAVIEETPAFPGCEDISSNKERKQCTSQKITEFVGENYDSGLGEKLGLTGTNRVIVQFKIDKNGNIQEVKSRAAAPELEQEAERVINSLPTMTPGKHRGEPVGVMYSLPIVFQVNE
ncbi:M56 family metallopeptidase [Autumnicola psychrophila]|uniref:M56 family metallopeptidase n=1 Tax=Autumnicola psychrophila TaxID=3075592 RepID=A0ABU3DWJ5_9FLAO|nr:M56 family metallopeptidase [Zunongwangia sp. F225]MDT0688087.1 M56 family metallopeptidase [Zunongwangia sp. F225]